jgi:hypothetical protein
MQPADWRATLQRQVEERDRLDDINHSGPAPAFLAWVDEVQLPQLAQRPHYQRQFRDRVTELQMLLANLEQQIAGGRLDLQPEADRVAGEITWLTDLVEAPHA